MSGYSHVVLMGTMVADAEVRYISSGKAVVKFTLVQNERWKDKEGEWQEHANFIECQLWGKRAEAFAQYHRKGSMAMVHGTLHQDTWEDKQTGKKRYKVIVQCQGWAFTSQHRSKSEGGARADPMMASRAGAPPNGGLEVSELDETPF